MRWMLGIGLLAGLAFAACSSSEGEKLLDPGTGTGGTAGSSAGSAGSAEGGAAGEAGAANGGAAGSAEGGAAGSAGSDADAAVEAGPSEPFTGTWALLLVMTSEVDAPVVGKSENPNRTVARVEQIQSGDSLTIKYKVCDFDIGSSDPKVTITVTDAFVNGLPEETLTGTLSADGAGYKLEVPKFWQVRSVKLANIETDPLPTDPKDPKVEDWDKDGKPGLTVTVDGGAMASGDMYVIQRTWTVLQGTAAGTDSMDGTISWGMEQVLLDATNPLMKMMPSPVATTDPAKNYFRHRRIDAAKQCADIVAEQNTIFQE